MKFETSLLWGYDARKCDGEYCPNDCDNCYKAEIEADGFITRPDALERVSTEKAKPIEECAYPKCEDCDKYHGHYCTVPMVVTKQMWLLTADAIAGMDRRLKALDEIVTNELIGEKGIDAEGYHKQVLRGAEVWCPDGCHIETHDGIDYYVLDGVTNEILDV